MLLLGILSVALSVTVMILTSAITNGFQNQISNKIYNFWGHIHISANYMNDFFDAEAIHLSDQTIDEIKGVDLRSQGSIGAVKSVTGIIQYPVILQNNTELEGSILRGIDDDYPYDVLRKFVVEGSLDSFMVQPRSVLLSEEINRKLNTKIGQYLILNFVRDGKEIPRRFKVAGIYNTGLLEYDEKIIFVQRKDVAEVLNFGDKEFTSYEIVLDDPRDIAEYDNFIYENIIPSELFNYSIEELFSDIFNWVRLQETNEKIIIGLLLIVCIINMVTVFFILVMEKVQLIGLFKAIGATDAKIRRIFIYLALRILLIGLGIGNFVALGLGFAQQQWKWFKLKEADYYIDAVPIEFNLEFILFINVLTLLMCFLFMFLPAMILSKINPSKTLRFT
ncbi:hypothetical protein GCM10025777_56790 [Membranihabitans marinus]